MLETVCPLACLQHWFARAREGAATYIVTVVGQRDRQRPVAAIRLIRPLLRSGPRHRPVFVDRGRQEQRRTDGLARVKHHGRILELLIFD